MNPAKKTNSRGLDRTFIGKFGIFVKKIHLVKISLKKRVFVLGVISDKSECKFDASLHQTYAYGV